MADDPIPDGLRENMNDIAAILDQALNKESEKRVGFALLVFDFGEGGNFSYISNGQREDMIKVMEEFLEKHRNDG